MNSHYRIQRHDFILHKVTLQSLRYQNLLYRLPHYTHRTLRYATLRYKILLRRISRYIIERCGFQAMSFYVTHVLGTSSHARESDGTELRVTRYYVV